MPNGVICTLPPRHTYENAHGLNVPKPICGHFFCTTSNRLGPTLLSLLISCRLWLLAGALRNVCEGPAPRTADCPQCSFSDLGFPWKIYVCTTWKNGRMFLKEFWWDHLQPMGGRSQWKTEKHFYSLVPWWIVLKCISPIPLEDAGVMEQQLPVEVVNFIAHPYIGLPASPISPSLPCTPVHRKNIST